MVEPAHQQVVSGSDRPAPDFRAAQVPSGRDLGESLLSPAPGTVHLWAVALDVPADRLAACQAVLSSEELERSARFHFDVHRDRYIAGRGALRHLLSRYLSLPARVLEFEYGANGKPALAGAAKESRLEFNLAHSEGQMLIAVTESTRVGVDLECVRELPDAAELVRSFFSAREIAEFEALPNKERSVAFFRLWTCKEAWLKATGEGIANLLRQVEVSVLSGGPAKLLSLPQRYAPVENWVVHELSYFPGFTAALVVAAPDARPEFKGQAGPL
jgi:4'-phosphopantetheinyl transferase